METVQRCPACGTAWTDGVTCQDYFYQMDYWELENAALYAVHHLMVLCYHLQHPHLYSREGLQFSTQLLVDFVERGVTPQNVRQQRRDALDSGKRTFKITARPDSVGVYPNPVHWTMTAADVVAGGADHYVDNVKAWAQSVFDALKASGNLAQS
ncbi:MAG: hypothetical protein IT324_03930 [Anaerolineae bacterium]|nr:hypothetical protein [Anaerolineae bacterium]